jgi:hypothetical protein
VRPRYVRFVTPRIDESSCRRQGVFHAVGDLVDTGELPPHDLEELIRLRRWFNTYLAVPNRFSRSWRRNAAHKTLSWFKSDAREHVRRMRLFCRILDEHGVWTEMITSAKPGYVVFEDRHQVAAVPFAETMT